MKNQRSHYSAFYLLGFSFLVSACSSLAPVTRDTPGRDDAIPADSARLVEVVLDGSNEALLATLPPLNREFRGVWVATVDNIDWPSEPGLSTADQQAEMLAILDRVKELKLNAIIFQVRPTADAFYLSEFEPWSAYLTGTQGKPPDPYYDPLSFTIQEAHDRAIEVHAWVNPFRAYHPSAEAIFDSSHVSQRSFTVEYGTQLWMDPGNPDARAHSLKVIMDIVDRYDVDGIHMDDYFYPYPVQDDSGATVPFPDEQSWQVYNATDGSISKDDWRRQNVDDFIKSVYDGVKERKPWVKFGISPFGIWRPGFPEGIVGFDAYDSLYADSRKWLVEGWVDYFSPQLYWAMESEGQPYPKLLDWWIEQNEKKRHIWPGIFTSRIRLEGSRYWGAEELLSQIEYTRATPGAEGNIHFSMVALMPADYRMGEKLGLESYTGTAIVPASPWLNGTAPGKPVVQVMESSAGKEARIFDMMNSGVWLWVVRTLIGNSWQVEIVSGSQRRVQLPSGDRARGARAVAISAIDRTGLEGPISIVQFRESSTERRAW
ncbi:MAG: hypothetical protein BMS9Abin05_1491 [Rhodothermia bacterium]|nr:MAG: hypothetical protein BMS9Abin05_1491 [Rhodothermia bacterium]